MYMYMCFFCFGMGKGGGVEYVEGGCLCMFVYWLIMIVKFLYYSKVLIMKI